MPAANIDCPQSVVKTSLFRCTACNDVDARFDPMYHPGIWRNGRYTCCDSINRLIPGCQQASPVCRRTDSPGPPPTTQAPGIPSRTANAGSQGGYTVYDVVGNVCELWSNGTIEIGGDYIVR